SRGPAGSQAVPARRGQVVVLYILQVGLVGFEAVGRILWWVGISQIRENFLGPPLQEFWPVRQGYTIGQQRLPGQQRDEDQSDQDCSETRCRNHRLQARFATGLSHHLGRRRLSCRQGCRQRVAPRQASQHFVRRPRPIFGVLLQAAQDDALQRRIH